MAITITTLTESVILDRGILYPYPGTVDVDLLDEYDIYILRESDLLYTAVDTNKAIVKNDIGSIVSAENLKDLQVKTGSGLDILSSVDEVESSESFIITARRQMAVFDCLINDGVINIDGTLILNT